MSDPFKVWAVNTRVESIYSWLRGVQHPPQPLMTVNQEPDNVDADVEVVGVVDAEDSKDGSSSVEFVRWIIAPQTRNFGRKPSTLDGILAYLRDKTDYTLQGFAPTKRFI